MRIDQGAADALIGCDLVVSSSPKASGTYRKGMRAVVNTAEMPTGDVVRFATPDLADPAACAHRAGDRRRTISTASTPTRWPSALLGDTVYANVIMLGFAWQQGLLPVSLEALLRAIELNGVAVERTSRLLPGAGLGAADPDFLHRRWTEQPKAETLDELIDRRATS